MHVIEGAHSMSRWWLSTSSRPEDLTEAIIMQHKPISTVESHLGGQQSAAWKAINLLLPLKLTKYLYEIIINSRF